MRSFHCFFFMLTVYIQTVTLRSSHFIWGSSCILSGLLSKQLCRVLLLVNTLICQEHHDIKPNETNSFFEALFFNKVLGLA